MTETERNQIKGALLKCAEENENKFTLTSHIVVSSLCKSAVERIAELEKENAELKSKNCWKTCEYVEPKSQWISQHIQDVEQLTKAKELIKEMLSILPKENIEGVYEITEEVEHFLREVEK